MKLYYLQCKQFQLVVAYLVKLDEQFWALSKFFSRTCLSPLPWKKWPVRLWV